MNHTNHDAAARESQSAAALDNGQIIETGGPRSLRRRNTTFTVGAIVLLTVVNLLCYWRSINGYFLADDFVHVPWLARVCAGHPELLLQNFVSNWMQTDGTQFYRPLISITLAIDYAFWGVNAMGFHITNIVLQIASSIFLFLGARRVVCGFASPRFFSASSSVSSSGSDGVSAAALRDHSAAGSVVVPAAETSLNIGETPFDWRGNVVALLSGLLFSVSPLHSEVVSWIIGRVDSVATMFYLCALWLFIRAIQENDKRSRVIAFISFGLSLLSKEIAITLPAVVALYCFMTSPRAGLMSRVRYAVSSTKFIWLMFAIYLGIRTTALGTVGGGYGGSIGSGLTKSLFQRWFGDGSLMRIFFPFNAEAFGRGDKTHRYLRILYQVTAAVLLVRFALMSRAHSVAPDSAEAKATEAVVLADSKITRGVDESLKHWLNPVVFAAGWFVAAMAPVILVWSLTDTLQGSRFIYLGTAPLSLMAAALLAPMSVPSFESLNRKRWLRSFNAMVTSLAVFLTVLFGLTAFKNNEPWVEASNNVRALKEAIEQQLHGSSGRRLALLNLPQQYRGAHMIYNGSMFSVLISPPLSAKDYSNDVATFEPIMFGDSQLVSASRLKRIARSNQYNLFRWDQDHMKLAPLLEPVGANQTLSQSHANPDPNPNTSSGSHANQNQGQVWSNVGTVSSDRAVTLKVPHIAPDRYDFIQITVRAAGPTKNPPVLQISWAQDNDDSVSLKNRTLYQPLSQSTDVQTLAISLAEHKSWIGLNHIDRFSFSLPGRNQQAVIDKISLLPGNDRVPRLEFDLGKRNSAGFKPSEDARGVVWVGGAIGPFSYDISDIPQADHAVYELSKRDFWFGNKMRDQVFAAKETELTERADLKALKSTSQEIKIAENLQPGYYDFRIFAVDNKGEILGYSSDPVNLWIKPSRGHAEKRN